MHTGTHWQLRFFTIWSAQAVSMFGTALVQFALVWWLAKTTNSATTLALANLAAILPHVLLGPLAGVFVDRWNRRLVMIVADAVAALAILILFGLFASNSIQVWHIYAATLLRATMQALQAPAMQASTALLVPQEQLSRVAGLNQMLQGLNMIAAPPLAALLVSLFAVEGILLLDVVTAVIGIVPLFFFAIPQPQANPSQPSPSVWGEFRAGLAYIWAWPGMLILIGMAALINFLAAPAMALRPILVMQHFGGDVGALAITESAFGIGIIGGGLSLGIWGGFKRRILTSLLGIGLLGLALFVVGLLPSGAFWGAVAAMGFAGLVIVFANGPLMAVLQSTVAPAMQGRVFSLLGSVSGAMAPLGLLLAGPTADRFGVQTIYLASGLICMLMAVAARFTPAVVTLEDHASLDPNPNPPAAEPRMAES